MKRFAALFTIALLGCAAPPAPKPSAQSPALSPTLDRCADRLQEICGIMLEYYVDNRQLPATMEQLQAMAAQQNEPSDLFICPVSRLRYVYNPNGILISTVSPPARLVMYDAAAVHVGHRWGIAIGASVGNHPLICRVVMVPDKLVLTPATSQPAS